MKLALTLYFDSFGTLKNVLDGLPPDVLDAADITTTEDAGGTADPCPNKDADGIWRDADDVAFDPALHAWNKEHQCPSLTPSGKFRRKRGVGANTASGGAASAPAGAPPAGDTTGTGSGSAAPGASEDPEDADPGTREVTPDTLSPVGRAIHSHIEHAPDAVALNRIEANPTLATLSDPEREFLEDALRRRAEELIAGAETG